MSTYRVTVTKARTGETFTGVMSDDGLQSMWTVYTNDGVHYASVLDSIEREPISAAVYESSKSESEATS